MRTPGDDTAEPGRLRISEQQIDLWLAFYQEIVEEPLLSSLRMLLNDAERRQERRFYFADDRHRYLVTRAMVRTILSRYADVAPPDWVFATNAYGRPEIADPRDDAVGISFNISHTRGLIALAVSRHRALGVDVENVGTRQVMTDIADRFFSPVEAAELAAYPPEQRHDRFFEYWTFKESYIKARGMGLSIPLDQFSFRFPCEHTVRLEVDPALGDDAGRWTFWQFRPAPDFLLALCAERVGGAAPSSTTIRKVVPTVADAVLDVQPLKRSEAA